MMFAVAMFHSISDGFTISSAGVAVGMVAPTDRQAGAQGLLGGVQTLTGGIAALGAGALYDGSGRTVAYTVCAVAMARCSSISGSACSPGRARSHDRQQHGRRARSLSPTATG